MENRLTLILRFEEKYIPEPNSGCYLWTAHTSKGGYGRFGMNGAVVDAHRAAYKIYIGEIPEGRCVLHRCDVTSCVRPDHLFIGSQHDNLKDMRAKGRGGWASGEKSGAAKLTEGQVKEIRADPRSGRKIAVDYGIGKSTVASVKSGKSWRTA